MTHTPGLELRRGTDAIRGHNMIEIEVDGHWYPLAQMGIANISGPTLDAVAVRYRELGDAAGKLLLAAPDLLAALEAAADALASDTDEWGSVRHKTEVAQARAAIEKAEGK